jgi:dynein heavy chain
MVFLTPDELGWRPYVNTWIKRKFPDEEILTAKMKDYLLDLFEICMDHLIEKARNYLTEPIATVNLQLVSIFSKLLGCINLQLH